MLLSSIMKLMYEYEERAAKYNKINWILTGFEELP